MHEPSICMVAQGAKRVIIGEETLVYDAYHFRAMTTMSPLQFQKWLRLHEARQLMFTEHVDAATAAFQVGYESPSPFNREYSRLFGAPPLRDIKTLRQATQADGVTN